MKKWPLALTVICSTIYLAICVAGILLRAPYWRCSPNVAPDFSANNMMLMWAALIIFPFSLIAIFWQALAASRDLVLRRKAVYSSAALISIFILYALIFHPAPMSGFYEPSYCSHMQRAIYSAILSYTKSHHGKLPNSLADLPTTPSPGCLVRTAWLLPPGRKPYALNNAIAGKTLADIPDPDHIVLLADSRFSENLHSIHDIDWERHGKACAVIFCDGRVAIFYAQEKSISLDPWQDTPTNE